MNWTRKWQRTFVLFVCYKNIILHNNSVESLFQTPENCKYDAECNSMMVSWEGEAEIQSGDILLVEINDTLLNVKELNLTGSNTTKTKPNVNKDNVSGSLSTERWALFITISFDFCFSPFFSSCNSLIFTRFYFNSSEYVWANKQPLS